MRKGYIFCPIKMIMFFITYQAGVRQSVIFRKHYRMENPYQSHM